MHRALVKPRMHLCTHLLIQSPAAPRNPYVQALARPGSNRSGIRLMARMHAGPPTRPPTQPPTQPPDCPPWLNEEAHHLLAPPGEDGERVATDVILARRL